MRSTRRMQITIILIILINMSSVNVFAEPETPHYNFDAIWSADVETQNKIDNTITEINTLDEKISQLIYETAKNKAKIDTLNSNILSNTKQIQITKKNLDKKQKLLNARMRAMYEHNYNENIILALLDSKGIDNLINRLQVISKVMNYDTKMFNDVKDAKTKLEAQQKQLNKDKADIVKLNEENLEKQNELVSQKSNLMSLLASLKIINSQNIQTEEVKNLQNKLTKEYLTYQFPDLRLPQQVISYKSSLDFYSSCDLSTPIKVCGQDIVMYASSFMGVTYLWGGNTPTGFDCSGFTKYVYKHFGIIIPRVAEDQQKVGMDVSNEDNLQPGDLLFFGQPAHHVAIFVSKGFMLEAPYTGDVVKVSPIRPYTNAKRYVNISPEQIKANNKTYSKTQAQPNELDDNVQVLPQ